MQSRKFVELTRLALVFAFQFLQPHHQLRSPLELDFGRVLFGQQRQRDEFIVVFIIFLLDVVDRARRLRIDRPCDVGPLGRAFGELKLSCRRTDAQGSMLNRALAPRRDFERGV